MKINVDDNKRSELFIKQEKHINIFYSDKKNTFKQYIDEKTSQFKNKLINFKLFYTMSIQYSEIIKQNLENMQKIFINTGLNKKSQDPILSELDQILTYQCECEEEKYERLNSILSNKKPNPDWEKKGREAINIINKHYQDYTTLIDALNSSHINYLRNFNDFEMKMIKDETKETKETEEENLEHFNPKEDKLLIALHNKENIYKSNLDIVNKKVKSIYNEVNKSVDEFNKMSKEMNDVMESILTDIYLGFITTNKMQKNYEKRIINIAKVYSGEIPYNRTEDNKNNQDDNNSKDEKEKIELDKICQPMKFESYNLLSPFANLVGYKQQNKFLEKLKPEIIYKISCIINSEFNYIPKVDLKEQYQIIDVKLICQRILESTSINKKEEEQLYKYLEERKYMLAFLSALNKTRAAGKFKLTKKSMIILGKAYNIIVDKLYKENNIDYEILSYLIIMSQTYYAIGINGKDKIYLIKFIDNSPYFQSEKLWSIYISEKIDKELLLQDYADGIWNLQNEESEKYKINQIYFSNIISLAQSIIDFRLDKGLVYKIIHNLINTKYKISKEFVKEIDSLIENAKYETKKIFDPEKDLLE